MKPVPTPSGWFVLALLGLTGAVWTLFAWLEVAS